MSTSDPVLPRTQFCFQVGPTLATDPIQRPCQTQSFPELSSVPTSDPVWPQTQSRIQVGTSLATDPVLPRTQFCFQVVPSLATDPALFPSRGQFSSGWFPRTTQSCSGPKAPTEAPWSWDLRATHPQPATRRGRRKQQPRGLLRYLGLVARSAGSHWRPLSAPSSQARTFKR